jgi:hypothetical protein
MGQDQTRSLSRHVMHIESRFLDANIIAGGGTQVMSGWNMVKNIHFELHGKDGKAWYDEV